MILSDDGTPTFDQSGPLEDAKDADGAVDTAPKTELTREQLEKELAKVRREAAGSRIEKNQLKETLAELQKYKDAEKTDLEKLTERAERAENAAKEVLREKAARDAAKQVGLDPDLADLLRGDTEEELKASAEKLKSRVGSTNRTGADLLAGARGPAVGAKRSNAESFRDMFKNAGSTESF